MPVSIHEWMNRTSRLEVLSCNVFLCVGHLEKLFQRGLRFPIRLRRTSQDRLPDEMGVTSLELAIALLCKQSGLDHSYRSGGRLALKLTGA